MAIRVTQNMLNSNMLRNLHNSMYSMDKMQQQLSSGSKISKPSDDPVVATRGMFYRSSLMENEQYQRNIGEVQSWLELSDKALDEAGSIMHRIRELAVNSGNTTLGPDSLQAIGKEIEQLKEHLGTIANQTLGGKYIFGGSDIMTPPYDVSAGKITTTNNSEIMLEVSTGIQVPINVTGQSVFNYLGNGGKNVFDLMDKIVNDLKDGKPVNNELGNIDEQIDNLLGVRSTLGARANRIDLIQDRMEKEETTLTEGMSKNEDADIAEVITNLKTQENVHRAALGAGARIIQPSLLDFLR
ncbi:flagellar hook-associated protein FlgL [Brevibacillus choshinensis]|uniref:Flagellar hook-associated protein FlgL n=1 Tax=Brevibacillus choshinensis TaxID=54911 RepID=A0ABX7FM43_BRECH|nr:flagellar hook-associated protein FlgL [Brevibacillus choshinensis]QRG67321.1 flagellar hook-associated protein FlgL [Brevibacillus choshinensis]